MYIMGQRSSEGTIPQSNLCTSDKKKTIWGSAEKKKSRARKQEKQRDKKRDYIKLHQRSFIRSLMNNIYKQKKRKKNKGRK